MVLLNVSCHDLQENHLPNIEINNVAITNNYIGEGVTIDIMMSESVENIVVDLLKLYPVRTI